MGSLVFSGRNSTTVDADIQGRWKVVHIRDHDANKFNKVTDDEPVMIVTFSDGYACLEAGGNGISGEVNATGGEYQVARYMTTKANPCDESAKTQEHRLYRAFSNRGFYELRDDKLHIMGKDKSPSMILERTA